MAAYRNPLFCPWEETECFTYYDMLTTNEIYEIVGSQLTETDVEVLSYIVDEMYPSRHPLNPKKWTEMARDDSGELEVVKPADPRLVKAWRRRRHRASHGSPYFDANRHTPKCGVALLMELEKRGHLSEANFEPLLQLLRVLTRHDLLPFVTRKKRRTVSPERETVGEHQYQHQEAPPKESISPTHDGYHDCDTSNSSYQQWEEGVDPVRTAIPTKRKKSKGHRWTRRKATKPKESHQPLTSLPSPQPQLPPPPPQPPIAQKVTCDIRMRVRPHYPEQDSALRASVYSDKQEPLARQLELFGRASAMLRTRDLGCIRCDIKFSEVSKLDAFWADYLNGTLTQVLRDVFLTDALRRAAGSNQLQLLVSVDQDDYEQGRQLLLEQLSGHTTSYMQSSEESAHQ